MGQNSDNAEQLSEANYNKMQELKKFFKAAFIVSVIPSALFILIGLIGFVAAVMTAGLLSPPVIVILLWLLCVVSFVCFSYSKIMEHNGTIASIAAIILQMIFSLAGGYIPIFLLLLAGLFMQIKCLTKYSEIQYLKEQPGYPDFNTVFIRNMYNNRILSDHDINQKMNTYGADIQMDEISADIDNKGNIL